MAKITGLGGIFFKSRDPVALAAWYAKHLCLDIEE
jgi:predicted enzyme related to lactoylglutathione lyase